MKRRTANGERGNGERGTGNEDEDEHEDETIVSRTPNPKPRTPKGIHHRGAEDAKVRMNLSLARVDGGPLMALRGETANGERATANGEWGTGNGERGTGNEDEDETIVSQTPNSEGDSPLRRRGRKGQNEFEFGAG